MSSEEKAVELPACRVGGWGLWAGLKACPGSCGLPFIRTVPTAVCLCQQDLPESHGARTCVLWPC